MRDSRRVELSFPGDFYLWTEGRKWPWKSGPPLRYRILRFFPRSGWAGKSSAGRFGTEQSVNRTAWKQQDGAPVRGIPARNTLPWQLRRIPGPLRARQNSGPEPAGITGRP